MAFVSSKDVEAQGYSQNEKGTLSRGIDTEKDHRVADGKASLLPNTMTPRHDGRKRGLQDLDEVWTEYLSESERRDNEMLEACDKNMDVLLIFAGLFSSVLTAFIVNSYGMLQPDPQVYTNALLETIASQLRASASGSPPSSPGFNIPRVDFTPSRAAVRLNVFWFSSLTCSLLAALGAALAKQWVVEYPRGAAPSATPCQRAQHRQTRFIGITTWHFLAVIDFLPSLIQIAFVLFFIGLCDFLFSQNRIVGFIVLILCILGFLFIIFSHIAAMIYPSCPFRTPLSTTIGNACRAFANLTRNIIFGPVGERYHLWHQPTGWRSLFIKRWKKFRYNDPNRIGDVPRWARTTATLAESELLTIVNAQALAWLLHWVSDEDVAVTTSSFLPSLPASDFRTPLVDALPRLCTLFQSCFAIDGDADSFCPMIIPKPKQEEKIKILGRAIHRIMLIRPSTPQAGHATRVIGDIFGDAYLVFPPRGVHHDIHALVCSLFTADQSFHRRYAQTVQEQLFISLLQNHAISPWALVMVLDSLSVYISARRQHTPLSPQITSSFLSLLSPILRRAHGMTELSSAIGLVINLILDGTIQPGHVLRDKTESLPENLHIAMDAAFKELLRHPPSPAHRTPLEECLIALLRSFQEFAASDKMKAYFLSIRRETITAICQLLLQDHPWSPHTLAGAISVLDCYPDDNLPLDSNDVLRLLSSVLQQLPASADNDVRSILHFVSRLIDIGFEASGSPCLINATSIGYTLTRILERRSGDETKSVVLHSFARHAGFWFRDSGLLDDLQAAGINAAIIHLLSEPLVESDLALALVIADHLVPASPLSFLQTDPDLRVLGNILQRQELEPYTRQQCATVMLRLIRHLPEKERGQILNDTSIIAGATNLITADEQVERYMIEEWLDIVEGIAETHWAMLNASTFLDALQSWARTHGITPIPDWLSLRDHPS